MPHAGFQMLRQWGEKMANGSFVFTTNVDGQFQKAGFPAGRICEVHGSIHHLQAAASAAVMYEWQMAGAGAQRPTDVKIVHWVSNAPLIATAEHLQLDVDMGALRVADEALPLWPSPGGGPGTQVARPNIKMFCDESFAVGVKQWQFFALKWYSTTLISRHSVDR